MRELSCRKTVWQGREAYLLGNGLVRLLTLTGGGHIAEFRFDRSTGLPALGPLWVPPWRTIEPYRYREKTHAAKYGPLLEGKLLSGLAGHNICLDYFGAPSSEEVKQGLSQHGEAPNSRWRKTGSRVGSPRAELTLAVDIAVAGLALTRTIGSVANRLKGALAGLIGFIRSLYLCGFQQSQQVRKSFKNTICNTSLMGTILVTTTEPTSM